MNEGLKDILISAYALWQASIWFNIIQNEATTMILT